MLQRLLGETIVLSFNYSPAPAQVEGDAAMLEQVLVNLAVNARDAMPEGGRLTIGIARASVDAAPFPPARRNRNDPIHLSDHHRQRPRHG